MWNMYLRIGGVARIKVTKVYLPFSGGFVKHDPGATDGEDYDSEDERERKLLQLQEQLRQMQEQMKILVEESIR